MISSELRNQWLATICVNINTIAYGSTCGWPAPSFPILQSDKTPLLTGPLTMDQISWVAANMYVGAIVGNSFYIWLSNKYGRKISLIGSAIPQLIAWVLIIVATDPLYLYASRFLSGFGGGAVFVITPIFVSEIADDKIRGVLGSSLIFAFNFGMVIAFVLGNYVSYMMTSAILITIPILFLFVFMLFPETPTFLMKTGRLEEAENSMKYYRNVKNDAQSEAEAMLKSEVDKMKVMYLVEEKAEESDKSSGASWSDFTSKAAIKAVTICVVLTVLGQFCGCFTMLSYTADIFANSGSDMSANMATIIVGVIQLIGAYISTVLVDSAGRKLLLAVSAIGTAIGLVCLGLFTSLQTMQYNLAGYEWIPVASFSFAIFAANWGIMTLPFLVMTEVLPEKIRSFGITLCMALMYVLGFILMKGFPQLTALVGMDGAMFLFAAVSLFGGIYVILCIPETKGRSYDEIMTVLGG